MFDALRKNGVEFFGMQQLGRLAVGQLPKKISYLEEIYVDEKSRSDREMEETRSPQRKLGRRN
jgi:hypothetical protein